MADSTVKEDLWNIFQKHLADDIPLQLLGSFMLGYAALLTVKPQTFLSLALMDKVIQSVLAGFILDMPIFIVCFVSIGAVSVLRSLFNSLVSLTGLKYSITEWDSPYERELAISLALMANLMISGLLTLSHWGIANPT